MFEMFSSEAFMVKLCGLDSLDLFLIGCSDFWGCLFISSLAD